MAIVTLKNASILEEQNALAFFTNCDDQMPNVKVHKYLQLQR